MVNSAGSKSRILFLRSWLLDHTDDNHVITTEELIELYRIHGYGANRGTIYDDLAVLADSGLDIIMEQIPRNRTKTNSYHIGSRLFEVAELKMLVDAVASSRFITAEKSELLIRKLSELTNEENRAQLTARTCITDRMKTTNRNVLANTDTIFQAIENRRKVTFHYWDYTPKKEKVLRHDGELYVASPLALVWNDDRYYMAAFSDKRKKLVKFRVDRMCDVLEIREAAEEAEFNPAEYTRKVIRMFDDGLRERRITLRCRNDLMNNVLDRFGEETKTKAADGETFTAQVTVVPSSTFFAWIVQYKGGIRIEKPEEVAEDFGKMLKMMLGKC